MKKSIAISLALCTTVIAHAQTFPIKDKPVSIVVPAVPPIAWPATWRKPCASLWAPAW
jgi:hypothetical protein